MRVRYIAVVPDSVGDVFYWIFSSGAQTLSDSSLRASEPPTTAAESIRLIQLTSTPRVPGPSLKTCQQRTDLITVSAYCLIFHVICVLVCILGVLQCGLHHYALYSGKQRTAMFYRVLYKCPCKCNARRQGKHCMFNMH